MESEETTDITQEQETAPPPPPVWPLAWIWLDENGTEADASTGTATPADDRLSVAVSGGIDFAVPWSDIASVEDADHRLSLRLYDGTTLVLHKTGRIHDELQSVVMEHFGSVIRREALAEEALLAEFDGFATPESGAGQNCRVLVYETALCMTFASGDVVRIPFVFADINRDGYQFHVSLPGGTDWTLGKLGRETDRFSAAVDTALSAMQTRALEFVRTLSPSLSPLQARKLAVSFLDGRAARGADIRSAAPDLWKGLERELEKAGLNQPWKTLTELDAGEQARIGIKRSLLSGGEVYLFFMVPVVCEGKCRIVLEASSDASGSRATYVFDAGAFGTEATDAEEAMDTLNYGLYMVNFRREPIYLPDAQLEKPAYLRYRRALQRVPALTQLRRAFLGRVLHNEGWNARLQKLLSSDGL
ncbi:MAG: hypothetical protein ACOYU3_01170 [Bacillota bacterium]